MFSGYSQGYDPTRIYQTMAKAERGEPITIVVLGGSITQGAHASRENKRWSNKMADWWKSTFPKSTITLVNAGIGGTGSHIGLYRLQRDVLNKDPDFLVVEFSVNDSDDSTATQTMEGLIRQVLVKDRKLGVMMLLLGASAKERHKLVGSYYGIPMVCFADSILARLQKDKKTSEDIYTDGLHPNDLGMSYISEYLIAELKNIYKSLPPDFALKAVKNALPNPLSTTKYDYTNLYSSFDLAPVKNLGWTINGQSWTASEVGSEIEFELEGSILSLLYSTDNAMDRGRIEIWVDTGEHKILDAFWKEPWGPGTNIAVIAENLSPGKHRLHAKIIDSTTQINPTNHYFEIKSLLTAIAFSPIQKK
jgi:lysophospholipase L1-like esterase